MLITQKNCKEMQKLMFGAYLLGSILEIPTAINRVMLWIIKAWRTWIKTETYRYSSLHLFFKKKPKQCKSHVELYLYLAGQYLLLL